MKKRNTKSGVLAAVVFSAALTMSSVFTGCQGAGSKAAEKETVSRETENTAAKITGKTVLKETEESAQKTAETSVPETAEPPPQSSRYLRHMCLRRQRLNRQRQYRQKQHRQRQYRPGLRRQRKYMKSQRIKYTEWN